MNPNHKDAKHLTNTQQPSCTSPWTEAFQSTYYAQSEEAAQMRDQELQPTHDALSDIYNRGYRE